MHKFGYLLLAVSRCLKKTNVSSLKKSKLSHQILLAITVILCFSLTGCYDARETDELAYVMALGLDKGKANILKITLQVAVPKNIGGGSGGGGGGGGGGDPFLFTSVEAPTIWAGINMINTYTSRQIDLSHSKAIIFSEELAKQGVDSYLHAMIRSREFRPNMHVLISRTTAEAYLKSVNPKLETNPSKYYELVMKSGEYTGYIPHARLNEFYYDTESTSKQAVGVLASVNRFGEDKEPSLIGSTYIQKHKKLALQGDFKAGDIPRNSPLGSEQMGLAVFDGAKMVGELDGEETAFYNLTTGQYNHSFWTFEDPKSADKLVVLNIKQSRRPNIKVNILNGTPNINVKLNLEADIQSIQSGVNYENPAYIGFLESAVENQMKKDYTEMLEKVTKQYHSDIFGFGKNALTSTLTWDAWSKINWISIFSKSQYNVSIDLKIRRSGLLIRTIPELSTQSVPQTR